MGKSLVSCFFETQCSCYNVAVLQSSRPRSWSRDRNSADLVLKELALALALVLLQLVLTTTLQRGRSPDPQAVGLHVAAVRRRTDADDRQLRARVRLRVRPAARLRADAVHHVQRRRPSLQARRRRRRHRAQRRRSRSPADRLLRGAGPQLRRLQVLQLHPALVDVLRHLRDERHSPVQHHRRHVQIDAPIAFKLSGVTKVLGARAKNNKGRPHHFFWGGGRNGSRSKILCN